MKTSKCADVISEHERLPCPAHMRAGGSADVQTCYLKSSVGAVASSVQRGASTRMPQSTAVRLLAQEMQCVMWPTLQCVHQERETVHLPCLLACTVCMEHAPSVLL